MTRATSQIWSQITVERGLTTLSCIFLRYRHTTRLRSSRVFHRRSRISRQASSVSVVGRATMSMSMSVANLPSANTRTSSALLRPSGSAGSTHSPATKERISECSRIMTAAKSGTTTLPGRANIGIPTSSCPWKGRCSFIPCTSPLWDRRLQGRVRGASIALSHS